MSDFTGITSDVRLTMEEFKAKENNGRSMNIHKRSTANSEGEFTYGIYDTATNKYLGYVSKELAKKLRNKENPGQMYATQWKSKDDPNEEWKWKICHSAVEDVVWSMDGDEEE